MGEGWQMGKRLNTGRHDNRPGARAAPVVELYPKLIAIPGEPLHKGWVNIWNRVALYPASVFNEIGQRHWLLVLISGRSNVAVQCIESMGIGNRGS